MEVLPAPLPLLVCKALPDVKSLDALVRASPMFAEVFSYHATEILEHIMVATLHEHLLLLMRAHVLLHSEPQVIQATSDPVAALTALYAAAVNPLPRSIPVPALVDILQFFTLIHGLTTAIIEAKFDYLRTVRFLRLEEPDNLWAYMWDDRLRITDLAALPYKIGTLSPPSWIEEQRVMRALLRISLFSDLAGLIAPRSLDRRPVTQTDTTKTFQLICPWAPEAVLNQLRGTLSPEISERPFEQDEFDEILHSLIKLGRANSQPFSIKEPTFQWLSFYRLSKCTVPTVLRLDSTRIRAAAMFPWLTLRWDAPASAIFSPPITIPEPECSDEEYIPHHWGQTPNSMESESDVYRFLYVRSRAPTGPLKGVDWTVLRPLGLGFWDRWRLVEQLKLCIPPLQLREPPKDGRAYIAGVDKGLAQVDQVFRLKRLYDEELGKREIARSRNEELLV